MSIFQVMGARQAFEAGLTRYYTGKECIRGHVAQRMVSSGMCCECLKENRGKWRKENPEKRKAQARRNKASMRAVNPDAEKERLKRFYERKEAKREAEAGRPRAEACDICKTPGRTVFDHCHAGGHFRGWICDRCNKVLGLVYDSPQLLDSLSRYLENDIGKIDNKAA